jgi:hypothetical protein
MVEIFSLRIAVPPLPRFSISGHICSSNQRVGYIMTSQTGSLVARIPIIALNGTPVPWMGIDSQPRVYTRAVAFDAGIAVTVA